jgi:hypothetical protein
MLGYVHANVRQDVIAARSASRLRSKGGMVMASTTDMSTPVTRGELQAELAPLATKAELHAALAPLATKAELHAALVPLATKAELVPLATKADLVPLATKAELDLWGGALLARMEASEQRLLAELARHIKAAFESMSTQISVIDEKYADLPRA